MGLNDNVIANLQEILLENDLEMGIFSYKITNQQLVNLISILSRCRNLTTLRLIIPDFEYVYRNLFEHCAKLVHLNVDCTRDLRTLNMLFNTKENCKDIESIQIVLSSNKSSITDPDFLKQVPQTLPGVTISLAISNFVIPITKEMLKSFYSN